MESGMADKSGGDTMQGNAGVQGSAAGQMEDVVGAAGAGAVDGMGGNAMGAGIASQDIQQGQSQGNMAMGGGGGFDNTHTDTNVNV